MCCYSTRVGNGSFHGVQLEYKAHHLLMHPASVLIAMAVEHLYFAESIMLRGYVAILLDLS